MDWHLLESSSLPKSGNPLHNEDKLLTGPRYWGVIDAASGGASPKAGPEEATAGHTWARLVHAVFSEHDDEDFPALIVRAAQAVADWKTAHGRVPFQPHGGAVVCVLDTQQNCVWRLGDCWFRTAEQTWSASQPAERVYMNFRVPLLEALQRSGRENEMAAKEQELSNLYGILHGMCSNNGEHPLGFGGLNGNLVPAKFVQRYELPAGVTELALGSDGYTGMGWTLAENEAEIERLRRDDPWLIAAHGVKAFKPGLESFDDRSFLKIRRVT